MLTLQVIFSGSSTLQLDLAKGELSRRALLYHMKGLLFGEFIELPQQNTALAIWLFILTQVWKAGVCEKQI